MTNRYLPEAESVAHWSLCAIRLAAAYEKHPLCAQHLGMKCTSTHAFCDCTIGSSKQSYLQQRWRVHNRQQLPQKPHLGLQECRAQRVRLRVRHEAPREPQPVHAPLLHRLLHDCVYSLGLLWHRLCGRPYLAWGLQECAAPHCGSPQGLQDAASHGTCTTARASSSTGCRLAGGCLWGGVVTKVSIWWQQGLAVSDEACGEGCTHLPGVLLRAAPLTWAEMRQRAVVGDEVSWREVMNTHCSDTIHAMCSASCMECMHHFQGAFKGASCRTAQQA